MNIEKLLEYVEGAADARNQPPVSRRWITEAVVRIMEGKEEVNFYPNGMPTLKGVYDVATRLEKEHSSIQ